MLSIDQKLGFKLMKGDIILIRYPLSYFLGWLIQGIGRDIWAHAAIYVGDGMCVEAKGDGIIKRNLVQILNLKSWIPFKYAVFRHKQRDEETVQKLVKFCEDHKGWKYDYQAVGFIGLVKLIERFGIKQNNILVNPLNREERFFCTEFVVEAYHRCGLHITNVSSCLAKAKHIAGSTSMFRVVI